MDLNYSAEELAFRDEASTWLRTNLPAELRDKVTRYRPLAKADLLRWHKILAAKGWIAPAWPQEWGGTGWNVVKRYIFEEACGYAGAPPLVPFGLLMCAPVLLKFGTDAQKQRFLPRIYQGEDFWCQGYSEPGAGSDLASLKMSARDAGDHFVCTGQKIWTTHAMLANRIFCLVRTSSDGPPQTGITFVLIDMATPGIEVRPITMLSGEDIQCEIHFRDVIVPKANVVGRIGDGWTVAKYLLQFERGGSAAAPGLYARLRRLRALVAECCLDGDTEMARKLAETEIQIAALEYTEHRILARAGGAAGTGVAPSMMKIRSTELSQRITELGLEIAGLYAAPFQPERTAPGGEVHVPHISASQGIGPDGCAPVAARYLNERAGSIYAGSNEIQRNIIAKAGLGL
jgi:alkylation response protein AidB-like acyl-CoA dehydrogenase